MKHWSDFADLTGHRWLAPFALLVLLGVLAMALYVTVAAPPGAWTWLALALCTLVVGGIVILGLMAVQLVWQAEDERRAQEMSNQCLQEAIEALPLGVAVYDQHDRLILYNKDASELAPYRYGGELIGQTFETIIRRSLERGAIADALGREDEWLRERLAGRGQLDRPLLRPVPDGRWMHLYEISTPSGCACSASPSWSYRCPTSSSSP